MNYAFKYAYKELITLVFVTVLSKIFKFYKMMFFFIFMILFLFYFYRRPNIKVYKNNKSSMFKSPCFGKVIDVKKTNNYIKVCIFLNITDVHVQYFPINCYLERMEYIPGNFHMAMFKKSENNERMLYKLQTRFGTIYLAQVAGMIARTIIPFVKDRKYYFQNEELGLIKFGSRVNIMIENVNDFELMVKEGDIVKAGETNIGQFYNF